MDPRFIKTPQELDDAIANGFDVNKIIADETHDAPFIWGNGDSTLVLHAISKGLDFRKSYSFCNNNNYWRPPKMTIFHKKYYPEALQYLVKKGMFDIKKKDSYGNTVLHCHSHLLDLPMIKFAIQKGFNPNTTNKVGRTILHYAKLNIDILKYMISKGFDIIKHYEIFFTCEKPISIDLLKYFIENGMFDINATNRRGETIFDIHSNTRNLDFIKYAVQHGFNINNIPAIFNNIEIMEYPSIGYKY